MAGKTFGFGVIGCGVIAPTHCRAIQDLPNARLVAVCDIEAEKGQALAAQFGAEAMTDAAELLKRDDIDVVNVLTWSGIHAEIGMMAARAAKHVIVTKPNPSRGSCCSDCRSQRAKEEWSLDGRNLQDIGGENVLALPSTDEGGTAPGPQGFAVEQEQHVDGDVLGEGGGLPGNSMIDRVLVSHSNDHGLGDGRRVEPARWGIVTICRPTPHYTDNHWCNQ